MVENEWVGGGVTCGSKNLTFLCVCVCVCVCLFLCVWGDKGWGVTMHVIVTEGELMIFPPKIHSMFPKIPLL